MTQLQKNESLLSVQKSERIQLGSDPSWIMPLFPPERREISVRHTHTCRPTCSPTCTHTHTDTCTHTYRHRWMDGHARTGTGWMDGYARIDF